MKLFIVIHSTGCRLNCSRNFLLFSGNFAYYFNLIVSASEHLIPKLSDYQILAAKVQAVCILELCLTKDLILNCVASGAFFVTLLSASCISLDSGQPTISYCFYAIKKCMLLEFFQQVLDASCSIRVYHSNRSHEIQFTQYLDPFKVVLQSNAIPLIILYLFCVQTVHTSFSFNSLNAKKADKG